MAYASLISSENIIKTAIQIIEVDAEGLSLRALASSLGVKAPSLYRYFPHKDALEREVAEQALKGLLAEMQKAAPVQEPEARFRATAEAYLRFAREHFPLYSFIMNRVPQTHDSALAKNVWNLLLNVTSDITKQPDDTAAAVAVWSFLHGYAILQHSGAFGASGSKGAFDLGTTAFLSYLRRPESQGNTAPVKRAKAPYR